MRISQHNEAAMRSHAKEILSFGYTPTDEEQNLFGEILSEYWYWGNTTLDEAIIQIIGTWVVAYPHLNEDHNITETHVIHKEQAEEVEQYVAW